MICRNKPCLTIKFITNTIYFPEKQLFHKKIKKRLKKINVIIDIYKKNCKIEVID